MRLQYYIYWLTPNLPYLLCLFFVTVVGVWGLDILISCFCLKILVWLCWVKNLIPVLYGLTKNVKTIFKFLMHSLPRFLEIAKLLFVFLLRFHRVLASKNYILDLCQLPRLTFWDHKMKTPHVSHLILGINYKSCPCLICLSPNNLRNSPLPITMFEYIPYFIVKFKIKCPPASWLSIAFSYTDLML